MCHWFVFHRAGAANAHGCKSPFRAILVCTIVCALPPSASLAASVSVWASAWSNSEPCCPVPQSVNGSGPVTASQANSHVGDDGYRHDSQASVDATYGVIRGTATAELVNVGAAGAAEYSNGAEARGEWADTFTIVNGGLAGTAGSANATITLDLLATVYGCQGGNCTSSSDFAFLSGTIADWIFTVIIGDAYLEVFPFDVGFSNTGEYVIPFNFTYGAPIDMYVGLNAFVVTDPEETGSFQAGDYRGASLAFDNTLRWQGLDDVLDANGDPVSFSVESVSGSNWAAAAAVPVPAAVWLYFSALGVVAGLGRLRGSVRSA